MKKQIFILIFIFGVAVSAFAATRFYLPSTSEAPAISPVADASWTTSTTMRRINCYRFKKNTPMVAISLPINAGNNKSAANTQYISEPIGAQTISGSVKGQMFCGAPGTHLIYSDVVIRLFGSSGTQLAVLLAASGNTGKTSYLLGSLQNRYTPVSSTLTSGTATDGSRIVIDIGAVRGPAGSENATQEVGDNSVTDLPSDENTSTANNPWIEFSQNIIFKSQAVIID